MGIRGENDMDRLELVPELSQCIETLARNEYREALRRLLAGETGKDLTDKSELLREFIETRDLKKLRRESEKHLVQGKKVKFIVSREGGKVKHEMKVE